MKSFNLACSILVLAFAMPAPAVSARVENITACGAVLDQPGAYKLSNDVLSCPGIAILVVSSDVNLNLGGHHISCDRLDGRLDVGIEISNVSRVSTRNGSVSDCDIGVDLFQSHHSKVTNVVATGNLLEPAFGVGAGIAGFGATHNEIIGNHVFGNLSGIFFLFGGNNRIIGNVANGNSRAVGAPYPTSGIGIAVSVSHNNEIIGNEANRNSDTGIVVGNGGTGNLVRDNDAYYNEYYGIGMFGRVDIGTPLPSGNHNQSNTALGNGRADMLEAIFEPLGDPKSSATEMRLPI